MKTVLKLLGLVDVGRNLVKQIHASASVLILQLVCNSVLVVGMSGSSVISKAYRPSSTLQALEP